MNKIFLDNNSTTPLDPIVLDEMIPFFTHKFGNPSSRTHAFGWEAEANVEKARTQISELINSEPNEIIFTSGATESNNLAIQNIMSFQDEKHIITMQSEHKAVIDICEFLKKRGVKITYLKPMINGIIDIETLKKNINENTKLISIMHANKEIGVIQPINQIGKICKENNILFHVDAAQSIGKINVNVKEMNVDYLSISGHKIYGPKGVGCLYINKKAKKISPLIWGGNQEKGLRPGTLAVPLIMGLAKACEISQKNIYKEAKNILDLRNSLLDQIKSEIPNLIINGDLEQRLPGNINITFPSLRGQTIIPMLSSIAISSGSACTSSFSKPSHVLKSIGQNNLLSNSSIRIGIGRFNTKQDIITAAQIIIKSVKKKSL